MHLHDGRQFHVSQADLPVLLSKHIIMFEGARGSHEPRAPLQRARGQGRGASTMRRSGTAGSSVGYRTPKVSVAHLDS